MGFLPLETPSLEKEIQTLKEQMSLSYFSQIPQTLKEAPLEPLEPSNFKHAASLSTPPGFGSESICYH